MSGGQNTKTTLDLLGLFLQYAPEVVERVRTQAVEAGDTTVEEFDAAVSAASAEFLDDDDTDPLHPDAPVKVGPV